MATYTLTDLERITGIKADTIRVWEKRYCLLKANRTYTNRRWYTVEDLKKLINVATLNRHGMKISTIASMPARHIEETAAMIAGNIADNEIQINALLLAMSEFNESAVNEIFLKSVTRKGFEKTISSVVFPFLRQVGVMWHTGSADVSFEHFISGIIRRKLMSAYESLSPLKYPAGKKILMFLPENEYHDLSMLFYAYRVRSRGHHVCYLGQSTPLTAVDTAVKSWNPDFIITGTLSGLAVGDYEEFITGLKRIFPAGSILFAGSLADYVQNKKTTGIHPVDLENGLSRLLK
ncbi:MAG TPA: helix-turn-helix-type transcriptional regulator [Bacteroidales bacterium]|nr:helix-turn-helix-type transcriptional regulator [Bacteroidales bacterium]